MAWGQAFESNGEGAYLRKGYQFELLTKMYDTSVIFDPITGDSTLKVRESNKVPSFVNSKRIFSLSELATQPEPVSGALPLSEYFMKNIKR